MPFVIRPLIALLFAGVSIAMAAPTHAAPSTSNVIKLLKKTADCEILHVQRCPELAPLRAMGTAAGPALTEALIHSDPVVRAAAATLVGSLRLDAAGPNLMTLLKDREIRVRLAALTALGAVRAPGRVEALAGALGASDPNIQVAAALALGNTSSPGAVEPLISALTRRNPKVRAAAARALGAIGDPHAVATLCVTLAIPTEPWPVKMAAARALGRIGDVEAGAMLLFALGHHEDSVRREAIIALGLIKDSRALPVISLLVRDISLAPEAIDALGRIGGTGGLPALIRVIKERRLPRPVLRRAFAAIGAVGSKSALPAIIPILKEDDSVAAAWAAEVLGQVGDFAAAEPLVAALYRDELEVREMVAWALQQISGKNLGIKAEDWERWYEAELNLPR